MEAVLVLKFARGSALAKKLVATGDRELVETNEWGDQFWGVCGGRGENWLGRLLMARRARLMMSRITLVNHHVTDRGEYIGRPSPLGNPFTHKAHGTAAEIVVPTREEAVRRYGIWLQAQIVKPNLVVVAELKRLAAILKKTGKLELRCWCVPLKCHGEVIKAYLELDEP
jgi:hypothetical protein